MLECRSVATTVPSFGTLCNTRRRHPMTEETSTAPPLPRTEAAKSLWRNPWFWGIVAGLIAIPAMRPFLRFDPSPPPVIGELAQFSLIDTDGEPYGTSELEDQVWVANFIFTRCASICPMLTTAMSRLDERYVDEGVEGIHLVSITVDPDFDTRDRETIAAFRAIGESLNSRNR
jgi:protein SCO1/2